MAKALAKENGVNSSTFYSRVNNGWDPKDAANIPTRKQIDRKELKLRLLNPMA